MLRYGNNLRKFFFVTMVILSTLIVLCATVSCGDADEQWYPAGMKLASSDKIDYKMWVPDDWIVDISTGVTAAYVSESDRSNVTLTAFSLTAGDNYMSISQYWSKYKEELEKTFPDISVIDTGEDGASDALTEENDLGVTLLVDGVAAKKYVYTATVTGTNYKFMQVIFIREGYVYLLTYTAMPENYDLHTEDVDKIIENFRFS